MMIFAVIMLIALLFYVYFSVVHIYKHFFKNEKRSFFQIYIVDILLTTFLAFVVIQQAIKYLKF